MSYDSRYSVYSPYSAIHPEFLSDLSLYDPTTLIQTKLISPPSWAVPPDTQSMGRSKQTSGKKTLLTDSIMLSIQNRIRQHPKAQKRNAFVGGTDSDSTTEECAGQNSNTDLICCNCQAMGEIPMKIVFSIILGGLKIGAASAKEIASMAEDAAKKKIEEMGLKKIYELLEQLVASLLQANPEDIKLEPQGFIARQLYISFEEFWPDICKLDNCINWGLVLAEIFANVIYDQFRKFIESRSIKFSMLIDLLGELADSLIEQGVAVICSKILNCFDCGCWLASCKNHDDCCSDALHCERGRWESTGLCQPGVWVDGTVSKGYLCTHDAQCKPGLECNKDDDGGRCGHLIEVGESCAGLEQCVDGAKCCAIGLTCQKCCDDGDCTDKRVPWCSNPLTGGGTCVSSKPVGALCGASSECGSGFCDAAFFCANKVEDGSICITNDACQSGYCGGTCFTPAKEGGACSGLGQGTCETGFQCCIGSLTCQKCCLDTDCGEPAPYCVSGSCASGRPQGHGCMVDGECQSHLACIWGKCEARQANGSGCSNPPRVRIG